MTMAPTARPSPETRSRWRSIAMAVGRQLRAAPVSSGLTAVLWLVAAATGSLTTGPSRHLRYVIGLGAHTVTEHHWWSLVTNGVFSTGIVSYLAVSALILTAGAAVERQIGSGRTAALLLACQVLGSGITAALIAVSGGATDRWPDVLSHQTTIGASPALFGLLLAGSALLAPLWRRRLRFAAITLLVVIVLYAGGLGDVTRLIGGLVGLAIGMIAHPPRTDTSSAPRDRRAIVAVLAAATAVGPLSTLVSQQHFGPLATLDFLFAPSVDRDDIRQWCARIPSVARQTCHADGGAFLIQGLGPLFQALLPALIMLVLAEGLRRGRRAAYLATVGYQLALAVIGAVLARRELDDIIDDGGPMGGSDWWFVRIAPIALPLAVAILVIVYRQEFPIRLPWHRHRLWVGGVGVAAAVCVTGYLGIGMAARHQFLPTPTFGQLVASLAGRLAPAGYLVERHHDFFPTGPVALGLFHFTGAAFWAAVLVLTVIHFWRTRDVAGTADRDEARALLLACGSRSSLAYMTMWRGNHYFFSDDRGTYLAYRVISGVAITTGGPIGPRPASVVEAFVAHCAAQGWTPSLFSIDRQDAELVSALGLSFLQVASDTLLDPATLAFTGKRWQDVRTALNRARRAGVTAVMSGYRDLPESIREQIAVIDRQWLDGKGLPQMGFTLGGLAELDDPVVRCCLAVDAQQRVLAVTSWLPGYGGERAVTGWTLDFMRRGPDTFPGTMEFLIAEAIGRFRDEGASWVSLSGVPLAWPEGGGPTGVIGHAVEGLAEIMEPVYGFRSLLAFKAKFDPEYRPLYLAYPGPATLGVVTNAVLRAYVPHLGIADISRLGRKLARGAHRPSPV